MRGGVPHLGGLPGQPCRVTRLGGVRFLHVNAEGGEGNGLLVGVMSSWAFIHYKTNWKADRTAKKC